MATEVASHHVAPAVEVPVHPAVTPEAGAERTPTSDGKAVQSASDDRAWRQQEVELSIQLAETALFGTFSATVAGLLVILALALLQAFGEKPIIEGLYLALMFAVLFVAGIIYGTLIFRRSVEVAISLSHGIKASTNEGPRTPPHRPDAAPRLQEPMGAANSSKVMDPELESAVERRASVPESNPRARWHEGSRSSDALIAAMLGPTTGSRSLLRYVHERLLPQQNSLREIHERAGLYVLERHGKEPFADFAAATCRAAEADENARYRTRVHLLQFLSFSIGAAVAILDDSHWGMALLGFGLVGMSPPIVSTQPSALGARRGRAALAHFYALTLVLVGAASAYLSTVFEKNQIGGVLVVLAAFASIAGLNDLRILARAAAGSVEAPTPR